MLTVLVALAATAGSVAVTRRNWPTDSDGARTPLRYLSRGRQAALLEYPVLCLVLGLVLSAPGILAGGGVTLIVASLVAVCLGGVLVIQAGALHRSTASR